MESLKRKQLSENFGPDLDAFSPSSSPSKLLGTRGVAQLLLTGHIGTKRQRTHLDPDTNSSCRYSIILSDHQANCPVDIPASTPGIPKTALDTGPAVEAIRKNGKPTGLVRFNSAGGLEHFLESTKTWSILRSVQDVRNTY